MRILFLIALVSCAAVTGLRAQGTVFFQTRGTPDVPGPRAYFCDVPLSGNAFWAQLYAADGVNTSRPESDLRAVGIPVNFRTGVNAGYVQEFGTNALGQEVNSTVVVTAVPGGPVTLQMRVWTAAFTSYEAAVSGGGISGKSSLFGIPQTGFPPVVPPTVRDFMPPFQILSCPEPSTYALALAGAAAFLLFRRRAR